MRFRDKLQYRIRHSTIRSVKKTDPLRLIEQKINELGLQAAAREIGVSVKYLQNVRGGFRTPGPKILSGLGLKREVTYRPRNWRAKFDRKLEGSSHQKLALELGVSRTYVSQVSHGARQPGPAFLEALGVRRVVEYTPL